MVFYYETLICIYLMTKDVELFLKLIAHLYAFFCELYVQAFCLFS